MPDAITPLNAHSLGFMDQVLLGQRYSTLPCSICIGHRSAWEGSDRYVQRVRWRRITLTSRWWWQWIRIENLRTCSLC